MERFSPFVRYEDTGPDAPMVLQPVMRPAMRPDPDGEYCRAELVERLAGLLRGVLDYGPPSTACHYRDRERYEAASDAAYALLEELGR